MRSPSRAMTETSSSKNLAYFASMSFGSPSGYPPRADNPGSSETKKSESSVIDGAATRRALRPA